MKRITFIVLAVAAVIIIAIYLIIPSTLTINNQVNIDASDAIAAKFLTHSKQWEKWWPGARVDNNRFDYGDIHFYISQTTNSGAHVTLQKGNLKLNSEISYLADDFAVKITWHTKLQNSLNPVERVENYLNAQALKTKTTEILKHLKLFLEDEKKTYGYKIYIEKIKDHVLLTSITSSVKYPDVQTIYETVNNLKLQAKTKGVTLTNFPMLNVTKADDKEYQVTVALPINKTIKPDPKSLINNLVPGANLLVADVKGGPNTINDAFGAVKAYMKDHNLTAPAMPFESLITDRAIEKDTSKWVTKIYAPIF
jgi:effector-binding domain-containing protein